MIFFQTKKYIESLNNILIQICFKPFMPETEPKNRKLKIFLHCHSKYYVALIIILMGTGVKAQKIEVIKADRMYAMIDACDSKYDICLFNFWATWCGPCIRELPHFEALNKNDKRVNVNLISLDEREDVSNKVQQFIIKKDIQSSVFLLDETDFNEIIPRISNEWSGAIPATLIIHNKTGTKYFYEKEFKDQELEKTIEEILTINN